MRLRFAAVSSAQTYSRYDNTSTQSLCLESNPIVIITKLHVLGLTKGQRELPPIEVALSFYLWFLFQDGTV